MTRENLEALQDRLGYRFGNMALLERALTHRSFAPENYERLEFLGDSVLNCVIGQALFEREDHFDEGSLSRVRANLVCERALHGIARELGIAECMRLGAGEIKSGGLQKPSILADMVEAIIGAVMLESGFEAARRLVLHLYEKTLASLSAVTLSKDPKSRLQEFTQGKALGVPAYEIVEVSGPAHDQVFTARCTVASLRVAATATGRSRRAAEQAAAAKALQALEGHEHG